MEENTFHPLLSVLYCVSIPKAGEARLCGTKMWCRAAFSRAPIASLRWWSWTAPNRAFAEFARTFDPQAESIRPEFRFGESRLDFCLTRPDGLHLVEVKGVTLEQGGHARFPDAPTERGVKHVHELIRAVEQGCRATAFFVIQMAEVVDFAPNDDTHPAFGAALRQAREAGVSIAAYSCRVAPDAMYIDHPVPVVL